MVFLVSSGSDLYAHGLVIATSMSETSIHTADITQSYVDKLLSHKTKVR